MASVDTIQTFTRNCTGPTANLVSVARISSRSTCTLTEQQCIRVTPIDTQFSQAYAKCFPHPDFTTGPFFDDGSIAAKSQFFVFTTYDDAKCTQFSTKALKSQHLSAFISNTCAQPDPRTSPTRFAKITCNNGQVTFQDKCDSTCSDAKCGTAPATAPEQLCIRNPTDPDTYIAGYCTVASSDLPKLPQPILTVTTSVAVTQPTMTTTVTKPSSAGRNGVTISYFELLGTIT
ncbi:hypothetical protein HDU97_001460 [Phlyctochytrium planicorne]|nr:hypothetical protein HDU97_001460 [Phlyctochytrium planicorne]